MSETNKAIVRRMADELWNQGNLSAADQFYADDSIWRDVSAAQELKGPAALKQQVSVFRAAFPDLRVTLGDPITEGDRLAAGWTAEGTHTGELITPNFRLAPTGKRVRWTGATIALIKDGKIKEEVLWGDGLALWRQLGLIAQPGIAEANNALNRRALEEVWNQGNLAAVDELYAPDYIHRTTQLPDARGREALKLLVTTLRAAFPDGRHTADDLIADANTSVLRWTFTGTHQGEFLGVPATGKRISVTGTTTCRLAGGMLAECWGEWDALGFLQQVAAAPQAKAQAAS
jgi:steroid delta-isomerase-like uncharacterized protein